MRLFYLGWKKLLNKCLGLVLSMKGLVVYEMILLACMSMMFHTVHISLLKWYKDGNRDSAPPTAMMVKRRVKLTGVVQACKRATGATDVVQD